MSRFNSIKRMLVPALGLTLSLSPIEARAQTLLPFDLEQAMPSPASQQIDTSKLLVPNASEVVFDFKNASGSSRYQSGVVGDWKYVLYPDGTTLVSHKNAQTSSTLTIECEMAVSCDVTAGDKDVLSVNAIAAPRPDIPVDTDAEGVARFLAQSILAETGTPLPAPVTQELPLSEDAEASKQRDAIVDVPQLSPESTTAEAEPAPVTAKPNRVKPSTRAASPRKHQTPKVKRRTSPTPKIKLQKAEIPVSAKVEKPELSFVKRYKLACSVSATASLHSLNQDEDENRTSKPRVNFACYARLSNKLSGRVSLVRYLNPSEQQPWDPDITYAFDYKVTDKIKLGYSNYSGRIGGSGNTFGKLLTSGTLRASVKLPQINLPFDKKANCSASIRLPDPKQSSARLFCGVRLSDKLSVAGTVHAYFPGRQESYQPDFTYTATYKISDLWSLTYSNYGNNRFPWNQASSPGRGILGGSLNLSYKIKF
ncbi:hypothetical protein [Planktotalea sp.]|uniref:hypothetical protein n=1 Tax=Planktotalea sp. TaxID=2029877 RepID=UPI003D6BBEB1